MGLRKENYYPLGTFVLVCIALCYASFINGQKVTEECSIRVKQEIRVNSMSRQASNAMQSYFNYYQDWQMPSATFGSGEIKASIDLVPFKTGEMLYISNFGFQIPEDSYIEGIVVKMTGRSSGEGFLRERAVKLLNGKGEIVGSNKAGKAYKTQEWSSEEGTWYYGTEEDVWGMEWTHDMINSSSFGVSLQLKNAASKDDISAFIDHVSIEVYYTEIFRFCNGDCVSFSATQNPDIVSYLWHLPGEFELLSISEKADIINVGQADAVYGKYEICVDLTDKYDQTTTCCRPFIFEECITPSLGDRVWVDENANGIQDPEEPGLEGIKIELFTDEGAFIEEAVSNDAGNYIFADLQKDDYFIKAYLPEGFLFSPLADDDSLNSDIDGSNGPGTSRTFELFEGDNYNIDIGITEELTIGDLVWEDCNGNGLQEEGEKGLEGIRVNLYNESGFLIGQTDSDSAGNYFFNQLYPGFYSMTFEASDGYTATISTQGNPDIDSNIDENGHTGLIDLTSGGDVKDIDAGFLKFGSIGNFVWFDEDMNGLQGQEEKGIQNITLLLVDDEGNEIKSISTSDDGTYLFDSLFPGEYILSAQMPEGYSASLYKVGDDGSIDSDFTIDEDGLITDVVTIKSGETLEDIDLGLIESTGSIGGFTWYDENVNGIYDTDETLKPGIEVKLLDDSGSQIAVTTTDDAGKYIFEGIERGDYVVEFSLDGDLLFTLKNAGNDESLDSDVDVLGLTENIQLAGGIDIAGVNAGYVEPAMIGDYVWFDENRNGRQDENESGLEGISLILLDADNNEVARTTTDEAGLYLFQNVFPAEYQIVLSGNGTLIPTNQSEDDGALDSDLISIGEGLVIDVDPLLYGQKVLTLDAGLMLPGGDIKGVVWNDADQDGIRQEEEERIADIPVYLLDENDEIIVQALTSSDGSYAFIAVAQGNYRIVVDVNDDYTATIPNIGDDGVDSDFISDGNEISTANLEVVEGVVLINIDAGLLQLSHISGFVWKESLIDGIRIEDEEGFVGIEVILYTSDGIEINRLFTEGESGNYIFEKIAPGSYYLVFAIPDNYRITDANVGNDDAVDSDVTEANEFGITPIFTVPGDAENISLGLVETGSISGLVWNDTDGNGLRGGEEPVVSGVEVILYTSAGEEVTRIISGVEGTYQFENIDKGAYYVKFEVDSTFQSSIPNQGDDDSIDSDVTGENGPFTTAVLMLDKSGLANIDLGVLEYGRVSGLVWDDLNGNGLRDEEEVLVDGIVVILLDSNGELIAQTVTGENGEYTFADIIARTYYLMFEGIEDAIASDPDIGEDDSIDSDVTGSNGPFTTETFTLPGNGSVSQDLGIRRLGDISGLVWIDGNKNGIREENEEGKEGVVVKLYDENGNLVSETVTDTGSGNYTISDIPSGIYYVQFEVGEGYLPTDPGIGNEDEDSDVTGENGALTTSAFLLSSAGIIYLDFGIVEEDAFGNISGVVWTDDNEDGLRDGEENGIDGVTVILYDASGNEVARSVTAEIAEKSGSYEFTDILLGSYYVVFEPGEGVLATLADVGSDDSIDSDVTENNGPFSTDLFTLIEGGIQNLDLGLINDQPDTGNIMGMVWLDANTDGILEVEEIGVNEIIVRLFNSSGIEIGNTVSSTIDNVDGKYVFEDVSVGDYYVMFEIPEGYALSPPDIGNDEMIDSDVTEENGLGTTSIFTLTNQGLTGVNLGIGIRENINGRVWIDENGNGIRDDGEPGRNGTMVILYDDEGIEVDRFTTSIIGGKSGSYQFNDIPSGVYYIQFEVMEGLIPTMANVGEDDAIDSDVTELMGPFTTSLINIPGTVLTNIDLGLVETSNISGQVWEDRNSNGIKDNDDPGKNDITVILYDDNNVEIDRMITSELNGEVGGYVFANLLAGSYYVQFEIQGSFGPTTPNVGGDDSIDSDVTGENGPFTTPVFMVDGQDIDHVDLGLVEAVGGMIMGRIWEDLDGDGIRETGEDVGGDLTVRLRTLGGALVGITTTSGNGTYMFSDIPDGNYYVEFSVPTDEHAATRPLAGDPEFNSDVTGMFGEFTTSELMVISGVPITNIDFGYFEYSFVGDFVWDDINANGIIDNGETGVNDIVVILFDSSGVALDSVVTQSNDIELPGFYLFDAIPPGIYYLKFVLPEGAGFTVPDAGNNSIDSDVTNGNGVGTTDLFEIFSGDSELIYDAGLVFGEGSIGDFVWMDADGNGIQGANESGINGIPIALYTEEGALVNSTLSAESDEGMAGYYNFAGLAPGNYYIVVELPDSLVFTEPKAGDEQLDSDVTSSIVDGSSDLIPVSTTPISNIDIGVFIPGSIGDFVWEDINKNGLQDDGEPGIKDVEVIIFTSEGTEVGSTFTDIQGKYMINGLKPGLYFLEFISPSSEFVFTIENEGMDETIDNDADASGTTGLISVTNGSINPDIDAGIYNSNTLIGGIVWFDENGDGIRNENNLLEGIEVQLLDEKETVVQETYTNYVGRYALTDILPGRYYVKVVTQNNNYEFTQHNVGVNGGRDSDVGVNGMSALIKVDPGNDPIRIDAGMVVKTNILEEATTLTNISIERLEIYATPSLTYGNVKLKISHPHMRMDVYIFNRNGQLVKKIGGVTDAGEGVNVDMSLLHQGPYYIKAVTDRGSATTMIYKF